MAEHSRGPGRSPSCAVCPESPREGQTCWQGPHRAKGVCHGQVCHAGGPRSRPGWRHRSGRGGTESFPGSDSPRGHPDRISPAQSPEVEVGLRQERGDPLPYRPPAAASTQQAVHMGARGAARQNSTRLPHNYASPELITASQDFPNGALEGLSASQPSIQHTYCRGSSKDLSGKEYWNSHTTDNSRGA